MATSSSALSSISNAANGTSTFDATTYVQQLMNAEQGPVTQMQQQVTNLSAQGTALGTISGQLSSLQTAAFALNDFAGGLDAQDATSSDPTVATATATAGATAGTHTLTVTRLATTSSEYSNDLADGDTTFATGSLTIQVGSGTATTVTVDSSDNTLNGLAAAINAQSLGVTADVLTDANGARLSLVSDDSGAAGQITLSANTTGLTFQTAQSGANASYALDGVPLASASNTVTGAIAGVTINLQSAAPASQVQITVAPDTGQMTTAITNFVNAYNTVVGSLNTQFTYSSTTQSLGPLGSDVTVMAVQQQLLQDATYSIGGSGGYSNLAALGINMNSDGTLTIDTATLNSALSADPAAVTNLFQQTTPTPGFAQNLVNSLLTMTDPTNGPLALDQNGITQSTTALNTQITAYQAQLKTQQTQLTQEYDQVAVTLQEMPNLLNSIKGQLASL